jgi:hypothetical protein
MAIEKRWEAIAPRLFTSNGGAEGEVTLASTLGFKVKQKVILKASTLPGEVLEVKRVVSETLLILGAPGNINDKKNLTAYTTALSASIETLEQPRNDIPDKEYERAVYAEEPIVAKRSILVDRFGRYFSTDNPIPVQLSDGSVNIGTVNAELEVQLSHKDNVAHPGDVADSVRIGDGVTEAKVDPLNKSLSTNRYEKLLPLLANANWMKLADFDGINPIFSGNLATLEYMQGGAIIGRAFFDFATDSNWTINLEKYINDANGDILEDDDGSELFLD